MSNRFLASTKRLIALHGTSLTYKSIVTGTYDIETASVTNTETSYTLTMYPKHIRATAYSFPDYVGKDVVMFYLANDSLGFTPAVQDTISYASKTYKVEAIQYHYASGQIVMYKLIATAS